MDTQNIIELAAQIRKGSLQGTAAFNALNNYNCLRKSAEENLVHFLQHYVADADIRKNDARYRQHQELHFDELLRGL